MKPYKLLSQKEKWERDWRGDLCGLENYFLNIYFCISEIYDIKARRIKTQTLIPMMEHMSFSFFNIHPTLFNSGWDCESRKYFKYIEKKDIFIKCREIYLVLVELLNELSILCNKQVIGFQILENVLQKYQPIMLQIENTFLIKYNDKKYNFLKSIHSYKNFDI